MCAKRFGSKSVGTGQVLKHCKPEGDSHNSLRWGRRVRVGGPAQIFPGRDGFSL